LGIQHDRRVQRRRAACLPRLLACVEARAHALETTFPQNAPATLRAGPTARIDACLDLVLTDAAARARQRFGGRLGRYGKESRKGHHDELYSSLHGGAKRATRMPPCVVARLHRKPTATLLHVSDGLSAALSNRVRRMAP
jgi:hypothetical protein